tara:strand:- start:89 stop:721 length:633 start_codon:yes stop_codon:yes gene_type:complete
MSTNFTLDKFKIEINSNFLGEEILLFGQKEEGRDIVIIFEGELKNAKLNSKTKEGFFWTNQTKLIEKIPSFFAIFSSPKKSLNELFLIPEITNKHFLIRNISEELYILRSALNNKGLYYEGELDNAEGNLFLKKFKIPDNIPAGKINIFFYEILNGEIISISKKKLIIEKKGLTNKLELLLYQKSFLYVFILVIFSMLFSLLSNLVFRKK